MSEIEDPVCFICLQPNNLINNICLCRSLHVHYNCQQRLVETSSLQTERSHCAICKSSYTNVKARRFIKIQWFGIFLLLLLLFALAGTITNLTIYFSKPSASLVPVLITGGLLLAIATPLSVMLLWYNYRLEGRNCFMHTYYKNNVQDVIKI